MNNSKNNTKLSGEIKNTFSEYFSNTSSLLMTDENRKKLFRKLTLIIICMFILALAGGLVRFDGIIHNTTLIIIYVLEILMMMALANGLFTLTTHYNSMIDKELKKSVMIFPTWSMILIIFCSVSFLGSILYVIINGFHNDVFNFIIYLLIKVGIGLLAYYFRYLTKDLEFKENKNSN